MSDRVPIDRRKLKRRIRVQANLDGETWTVPERDRLVEVAAGTVPPKASGGWVRPAMRVQRRPSDPAKLHIDRAGLTADEVRILWENLEVRLLPGPSSHADRKLGALRFSDRATGEWKLVVPDLHPDDIELPLTAIEGARVHAMTGLVDERARAALELLRIGADPDRPKP